METLDLFLLFLVGATHLDLLWWIRR